MRIEAIHLSTLKSVLIDVIRDSASNDPVEIANFVVDKFFAGIGKSGKVANKRGHLEFYSKYTCLDTPYENGRRLFILEG